MAFSTGFSNKPLFNQTWVDKLASTPEKAMVARVNFTDPETRTYLFDEAVKARVQPLRSAVPHERSINDTRTQTVLVSIPIDIGKTLDLRPKHRGVVVQCDLLPILTNYLFVVAEVLDSSNPIERTYQFTVDIEVVRGN